MTSVSPKFNRPFGSAATYYYQAIQVVVASTGAYTFTSSGTLDAYGIIYTSNFLASAPTVNIITQDDGRDHGSQFKMTAYLKAGVDYVLVFTTHVEDTIGSFSIIANGPDQVTFNSLTH